MADEIPKVKKEERDSDFDGNAPINAAKKEIVDSDDDEVPLAISRAKKKSAITDKSGVLKENSSKKIGGNSNSKASKVKKEETEDLKKKSVVKNTKSSKVKKEASDSEDEEEIKKKRAKKGENKGKENKKSNSIKKENKKQKKFYDLPGQKHDPPEERDPLRIFYESLYNQVSNSEMASIWMMERGLLSESEAKKVFEKKRQKGLVSPVKPTSNKKSTLVNSSVKKSLNTSGNTSKGKMVNSKDNKGKMVKKRKASSDEDSDDDFIASPKVVNKKLKV